VHNLAFGEFLGSDELIENRNGNGNGKTDLTHRLSVKWIAINLFTSFSTLTPGCLSA